MKPEEYKNLFATYKKIAIIGLSPKPERDSHKVARYLIDQGFQVVGVRPGCSEILGCAVYPTLADVPGPLEIVDVFRAPEFVPKVASESIRLKAKVLWLQEGVTNADAEETARNAGLVVISDQCIKKIHQSLA
ncbi:MAG: CoA-binding protein [Bdellovibrionales bacterium]|nr:CoA-binding protein [Bdellovibrionales bacterium]